MGAPHATGAVDGGSTEPRLAALTYAQLAQRLKTAAGIDLGGGRLDLVESRLMPRLRALGLSSFEAYGQRLVRDPGEEQRFVSALTTNLTAFFREPHHFEVLRGAFPGRFAPLHVWSAACSTGEEPYSIAMTLDARGLPAQILATDVDEEVLAVARRGVYATTRLDGVSEAQRRRYFERGTGRATGLARVREELKRSVEFQRKNLLEPMVWPVRFDVIFCRNVLIYFDVVTRQRVVDRLVERLAPRGLLFLGHSEAALGQHPDLEMLGQTTFKRRS